MGKRLGKAVSERKEMTRKQNKVLSGRARSVKTGTPCRNKTTAQRGYVIPIPASHMLSPTHPGSDSTAGSEKKGWRNGQ